MAYDRVKILPPPREILALLFPGPAVATGGFATGYANESTALNRRNFYLRCRTAQRAREEEDDRRQPPQNASGHVLNGRGYRDGRPFQKLGDSAPSNF